MQVAFVIECAWVAEIAGQAQLCRESNSRAVSHMRNGRRIVFLYLLNCVARKDRGPDSNRLNELLAINLDSFRLEIKALARASAGQQCAVISNMADNFYIFYVEKLWRQAQ